MKSKREIYNLIVKERRRQDKLWGVQTLHPHTWQVILGEEKGESDKAALEYNREDYITELIQTIAVGFAILEHVMDIDDPVNKHFDYKKEDQ